MHSNPPLISMLIRHHHESRACRMENGVEVARREVPFLFKAFETGQMRPPRPGTKAAEEPRASTIHEYLDWTVTAAAGGDCDDELVSA